MGFFSAIARLFRTVFGLAEGGTQRATDSLLTSSPDAIRNQFRKTQEDSIRDYNEMKSAVAELLTIRNSRAHDIEVMHKESDLLQSKMNGAIELYKKTQDEALRAKYGELAEKRTALETKIDEFEVEVTKQKSLIEQYKSKLGKLQSSIEDLKREEAETVADIISSRKINELNSKLQGLSTDTQTKNLEAIRQARLTAKAQAQLSGDLSGDKVEVLDAKLLTAGATSKHLDAFDNAVKLDKLLPPAKVFDTIDAELTPSKDSKDIKQLEELFKN